MANAQTIQNLGTYPIAAYHQTCFDTGITISKGPTTSVSNTLSHQSTLGKDAQGHWSWDGGWEGLLGEEHTRGRRVEGAGTGPWALLKLSQGCVPSRGSRGGSVPGFSSLVATTLQFSRPAPSNLTLCSYFFKSPSPLCIVKSPPSLPFMKNTLDHI